MGSCTDLIATVLKPLLEYRPSEIEQVTFSSFVDSRLLFSHLQGEKLLFSDETNYIWEKQIEEAEILVVNKIDLLSESELNKTKELCQKTFPSKIILYQNSLDEGSVNEWIDTLNLTRKGKVHKSIDVDYVKYGAGEANLAWLDEEIEIVTSNNSSVELAYNFISNLSAEIDRRKLPVGHLKYFLSFNGHCC